MPEPLYRSIVGSLNLQKGKLVEYRDKIIERIGLAASVSHQPEEGKTYAVNQALHLTISIILLCATKESIDAAEATARDKHIPLQQYGAGTVPSAAYLYHMLTEPRDALGFDVGLERERTELLSLLYNVDWCLTPEAVKELGFERAA